MKKKNASQEQTQNSRGSESHRKKIAQQKTKWKKNKQTNKQRKQILTDKIFIPHNEPPTQV